MDDASWKTLRVAFGVAEIFCCSFTADQTAIGVHDYHNKFLLIFNLASEHGADCQGVIDERHLWEVFAVCITATWEVGMDNRVSLSHKTSF